MVLLRGTLKYGGSASEAETLAAQVRQIEAQYPGDELVEATLSEAELKTGHAVAAEAAADRALKANPRNTEAMILKGDAIAARGKTPKTSNDRPSSTRRARLTSPPISSTPRIRNLCTNIITAICFRAGGRPTMPLRACTMPQTWRRRI